MFSYNYLKIKKNANLKKLIYSPVDIFFNPPCTHKVHSQVYEQSCCITVCLSRVLMSHYHVTFMGNINKKHYGIYPTHTGDFHNATPVADC